MTSGDERADAEERVEDEAVPFFDPIREQAAQFDALRAAFERVLASGRFILGPEVEGCERELAAWLGVRHVVGLSSGTDALLVGLMALGVGPGDEVVTTPFTFFATAGAVVRLGARPVFADIDPATFQLDPDAAVAAIAPRTRAVIPVHLFGAPCPMPAVPEGVAVLEDAAQAIGAAPLRGHAGTLSFFPAKNLGALGDGGALYTDDDVLADRVRVLRVHGARPKYRHHLVGGNFRLDALQAAFLRVKLPSLRRAIEARRRHAAIYREALGDVAEVQLPAEVAGHTYNQFVVRARDRDRLRRALAERGVSTAVYYPEPLHLQPCFADLGYRPGALPHAEQACREVLALPVAPALTDSEIRRVAEAIRAFYGHRTP